MSIFGNYGTFKVVSLEFIILESIKCVFCISAVRFLLIFPYCISVFHYVTVKKHVFTQMPRDTVWIMECNCNPEFIKLHVNK